MRARWVLIGWCVAVAGLTGFGCGGDDENGTSPETRHDAAADAPARDTSVDAGQDSQMKVNPAHDAPNGADADASVAPELDSGRDIGVDAGARDADASVADRSPSDVTVVVDAGSEHLVSPEVGTDGRADGASDALLEGGTSDAGTDGSFADGGEASISQDGGAGDALADSNDGAEASSPEQVHWSIEASPPECSADPTVVSCADGPDGYEVYAETKCPTATAKADLWFPAGAAPEPGSHPVHPAARVLDLVSVTGQEVALVFERATPSETWWGRSGSVDVQVVGGRRYIQFSDVLAYEGSNHARTTMIKGLLFCASTGKP